MLATQSPRPNSEPMHAFSGCEGTRDRADSEKVVAGRHGESGASRRADTAHALEGVTLSQGTTEGMMTHQEVLEATERMAKAASPWMGHAKALEMSRNAAVPIADGDDPYQCCIEAIQHRVRCGWLFCRYPHDLATQMVLAWHDAPKGRSRSIAEKMVDAIWGA